MAKKRADFIRLDFEHRRTLELKVQKDFQGEYRYDYYLARRCPSYSRSLLQRLIKERLVLVNGRPIKPSTVVQRGDQIALELPLILMPQVQPKDIPLEILFEDAHLIAINKPPDFVVHPAAGHWDDTLVNALLHHCGTLPETDEIYKPGIVHRIDKDTSGVILAAKTIAAHKGLTAQFAERTTRKEYRAIVEGVVERDADVIDRPMGRSRRDWKKMAVYDKEDEAGDVKEAVTEYQVLERFRGFSFVIARPKTGRTHQIRVHLASIGHPIVGDATYGRRSSLSPADLVDPDAATGEEAVEPVLDRQALHAAKLTVTHPATGATVTFEAPLPADMAAGLEMLRRYRPAGRNR